MTGVKEAAGHLSALVWGKGPSTLVRPKHGDQLL